MEPLPLSYLGSLTPIKLGKYPSGLPRWLRGKESCPCSRHGVWSLGQEDSLEEGVATHSSILAWRIPWTEESSRRQSMGSQKSWTQLNDWTTITNILPGIYYVMTEQHFLITLFSSSLYSFLPLFFSIHVHLKKLKYIFIFIWLLQVLVVAHGIFICGRRDPAPWSGIETGPPVLGAWSLSHWATGEVPIYVHLKNCLFLIGGQLLYNLMWECMDIFF